MFFFTQTTFTLSEWENCSERHSFVVPWHSGRMKSSRKLMFFFFLLCFLVLPTHSDLIATAFRVWQVCVCHYTTHSLNLPGRCGMHTPPDWGSFQTHWILSANCPRLVCFTVIWSAHLLPFWWIIQFTGGSFVLWQDMIVSNFLIQFVLHWI